MNLHPLLNQLQKLKESAKEAVADGNIGEQDPINGYLHVKRPVEEVIKDIIIKSAQTAGPSLLMVCGNVGDGKSHLLSNLQKSTDVGPYLQSFKIHNDATESFSPNETCNETLNKVLAPFSDVELSIHTTKLILLINLGTLTNFLEEYKSNFSKLNDFVERYKLIDPSEIGEADSYKVGNIFQAISFTNYHFFELTQEGAVTTIIENLLEKIIQQTSNNPIYSAYLETKSQTWGDNCPVKQNYEFLFDNSNRHVIANLLIQCILKERKIVSFRQILNFLHDLIVPFSIDKIELNEYITTVNEKSPIERLKLYTPYHIFEYPTLSKLFYALHNLDPCIRRNENLDAYAIQLHTSADVLKIFTTHLDLNCPYVCKLIAQITHNEESLIKLFVRLAYFKWYDKEIFHDDFFKEYTKALYNYNKRDTKNLKETFELVKQAVLKWNGSTHNNEMIVIPFTIKYGSYRVLKKIKLRPCIFLPEDLKKEDILYQFSPELTIKFYGSDNIEQISINVDYKLFVLLKQIAQGYRPNKVDRNNHVNFELFVEKIALTVNNDFTIYFDESNVGKDVDYKLFVDEYGDFQFIKMY